MLVRVRAFGYERIRSRDFARLHVRIRVRRLKNPFDTVSYSIDEFDSLNSIVESSTHTQQNENGCDSLLQRVISNNPGNIAR